MKESDNRNNSKLILKIFGITVFGIAMAYVESAVVVYLRELYYPAGFVFPLKPMSPFILYTELFREAATIIMLMTLAVLVAKRWVRRLAFFLYIFAVWDIFYYVFLYLLLRWPPSLGTVDVLFLIPVPWIAPVWFPLLVSTGMITIAVIIFIKF